MGLKSGRGNVSGVQPRRGEAIPRIRHGHVHVAAGPAEGDRLKLFLAVLLPHDAGHNRQRLVERVLGHAGAGGVDNDLAR
jgi:hypothetical protein